MTKPEVSGQIRTNKTRAEGMPQHIEQSVTNSGSQTSHWGQVKKMLIMHHVYIEPSNHNTWFMMAFRGNCRIKILCWVLIFYILFLDLY